MANSWNSIISIPHLWAALTVPGCDWMVLFVDFAFCFHKGLNQPATLLAPAKMRSQAGSACSPEMLRINLWSPILRNFWPWAQNFAQSAQNLCPEPLQAVFHYEGPILAGSLPRLRSEGPDDYKSPILRPVLASFLATTPEIPRTTLLRSILDSFWF